MVSQVNTDGKLHLMDGDKRVLDMIAQVEVREGIRPGTAPASPGKPTAPGPPPGKKNPLPEKNFFDNKLGC
jgi:hypothetical protein